MSVVQVGRYRIFDVLAAGGMAKVHFGQRVQDDGATELVAIKRLDQHLAANAELIAALQAEGRIAACVQHPNVLTARDVVVADGEAILAIDYVHGGSLAELQRAAQARGAPVPVDIAASVLIDALRGLGAAHAATDPAGEPLHLVHRDVSPHNILVSVDGIARIADFGIAKFASREALTRTGQVKGKLTYLAPEQVHGSASPRSDLFSLGVTAWELLAGRPLFAADSDAEVLARVLAGPIPRVSTARPDVPGGLDAAIARALQRPVERRFAAADDMADAITAATTPATAARVGAWVAETMAGTLAGRAAIITRIEATSDAANAAPPTVATPPVPRRRRVVLAVAAPFAAVLAAALGVAITDRAPPTAVTHESSAAPSAPGSASPPAVVASPPPTDSVDPVGAVPPPKGVAEQRPRSVVRDRRADCNPPFVFDEQHRKHYKPQCF